MSAAPAFSRKHRSGATGGDLRFVRNGAPNARRRPGESRRLICCCGLVLSAGTVLAYGNSVRGVMLFDDLVHIVQNPRIRQPMDLVSILTGKRPVTEATLAVNHTAGGLNVTGYHVFNVVVHVLAGLLLFGVVRRTLEWLHGDRPRAENGQGAGNDKRWGCSAERSGYSATIVAFVIALLWLVHPLQTQSVTYIIQRSESLMGMFYLLTLYSVIRAARGRVLGWSAVAMVSCALGMGSKGVMVTAPVVVLLYDRVFLSSSWKDVFRRRWGLYAGLCLTWLVLWMTDVAPGILSTDRRIATTGFSFKGIAPLEYLQTQAGVILRYLRLAVVPVGLCLDYAWPVARRFPEYAAPGVMVLLLLVATLWALVRRPAWGFVGAWFFVILAPTSSVIPIKDPIFEHRMYLPLASVVTVMVLAGAWFLDRVYARYSLSNKARIGLSTAVVCLTAGALMAGTIHRNRAYASAEVMWRDVVKKRPFNHRAHDMLGNALLANGKLSEAIPSFRGAVEVNPEFVTGRMNLANALVQSARYTEAVVEFRKVIESNPYDMHAHLNLSHVLERLGETGESLEVLRRATELDVQAVGRSELARAHFNLGVRVAHVGRPEEAVVELRRALDLNPEYDRAHAALGSVAEMRGDLAEAARQYQQAAGLDPSIAAYFASLGSVCTRQGRNAEAIAAYEQAVRLEPGNPTYREALNRAAHLVETKPPRP